MLKYRCLFKAKVKSMDDVQEKGVAFAAIRLEFDITRGIRHSQECFNRIDQPKYTETNSDKE